MSYQRPFAIIRSAAQGSEWRVFVNDSYRTTVESEYEAREWCRRRGIEDVEVER